MKAFLRSIAKQEATLYPASAMHKFIIPLFVLAFLLVSCGQKTVTEKEKEEGGGASSSAASALSSDTPSSVAFDGQILSGKHTVILRTSMGDITLELNADAAPKTVTNFVALAQTGYFNGLTFHRIMPEFMIQGGDPDGNGTGGESIFGQSFEDEINADDYGLNDTTITEMADGQTVPEEVANMTIKEYYESQGYVYRNDLASLPLVRGSIAMANRGPNTNGSQFFIIRTASTPWLNGKHTVFGNVTDGIEIVDAIAAVPRDAKDKPLEPITYTVEVVN